MGIEIERKFLVTSDAWMSHVSYVERLVQGYITLAPTVRVRINDTKSTARLTIKGKANGITRQEYEYNIPYDDAKEMMAMCLGQLSKTRHVIPWKDGLRWEVDVFEDETGKPPLVMAEIELPSEDYELTDLPEWVGEEVSYNPKYYNSNMIK